MGGIPHYGPRHQWRDDACTRCGLRRLSVVRPSLLTSRDVAAWSYVKAGGARTDYPPPCRVAQGVQA